MTEINDVEKIKKILKEKSKLIFCIYDEKCIISNMFLCLMKKIEMCDIKENIIFKINKTVYEEYISKKNIITPKIIVYEKGVFINQIDGFMNYKCLNNELKKYKNY